MQADTKGWMSVSGRAEDTLKALHETGIEATECIRQYGALYVFRDDVHEPIIVELDSKSNSCSVFYKGESRGLII